MLLRVRKEDLRLGMFVQSLEGSWFDHPFWRSKFLLTEPDDLRALQSSDVESVWIDQDRSLAPALAHLLAPPAAAVAAAPAPAAAPVHEGSPAADARPAEPAPRRRPRPNEYHAAQTVLEDCKAAVGALFARVGSGDAGAIE